MSELLNRIRTVVGEKNVLSGDQLSGRSAGYWRGGELQALALVRPASTEEVSRVLALCNQATQSVVTLGGATGLTDGHKTDSTEIALSLERMTAIDPVNTGSRTITVEAGAILQTVQEAAAQENLMFGLDLGARASCTIGGNICHQRRQQRGESLWHAGGFWVGGCGCVSWWHRGFLPEQL